MHEFGRFIQEQIDARGWTAAYLSRQSGLTESHLGRLIKDKRDRLPAMPEPGTITALANAFGLREGVVLSFAATACYGVPLETTPQLPAASEVSDDELLHELGRRMRTRSSEAPTSVLDINAMAHHALPQVIDLMESLKEDATASEARGDADLGAAQRFLAKQLEVAFEAAAATSDPARQAQQQRA